MMKREISAFIFCFVFGFSAFAKDNASSDDDLLKTEQRLKQLIKAAAEQDLVNVKNDKHKGKKQADKSKIENCTKEGIFAFPDNARINSYEELLKLKSSLIKMDTKSKALTIDTVIAKTLAWGYLGLGFADEAILMAEQLPSNDKQAVKLIGNILLDNISNEQTTILDQNLDCQKRIKFWSVLSKKIPLPKSDDETQNFVRNLKTLPSPLRIMLAIDIGLFAYETGNVDFARDIHTSLVKWEDEQGLAKIDGFVVFASLLELKNKKIKDKQKTLKKLGNLAKKQGPYQAEALSALLQYEPDNSGKSLGTSVNITKTGQLYPGFEQDLEGVTRSWSGHTKGKLALAQQVNLLAKNDKLAEAIALTKASFETSSVFFHQSAKIISNQMKLDLYAIDKIKQLRALDLFLVERQFFSQLKNIYELKKAAIYASIILSMPDLAEKIIPKSKWKKLDDDLLVNLALQYQNYLARKNKNRNFVDKEMREIFPNHILAGKKFAQARIANALNKKDYKSALTIKNKYKDKDIKNTFTKQAWQNGFWGLVANADLPKNEKMLAGLLASSPAVLSKAYKYNNIAQIEYLQNYLQKEVQVFQTYIDNETADKEIKGG